MMYPLLKRLMDIIISLTVLLLLSPLLIPLIVLLLLTGEGYVFYYQRRIGYRNKYFDIIKFATMLKNSLTSELALLRLRMIHE